MRVAAFALLTVVALHYSTHACAEAPPQGAVPFPVDKTTKVRAKDGPVFYIDGPKVIPKGAEITVQLNVKIVGINGASLDVRGGLKVHGTQDHWVEIKNVDFSPTVEPTRGFHLDMVDLWGCRFVHAEGAGVTGSFVIENAAMQRDCVLDVRIIEGAFKLMTVDSGIPWKFHCVPPDPRRPKILIQVHSSWAQGIELSGPGEANFRHSELKKGLSCRGVSDVTVDGCDVKFAPLAFRQGANDSFKQITLTKCNLFDGSSLLLDRPANPKGKKEKVKVDKFYFGPVKGGPAVTKKDAVAARIEDGADKPDRNVFAIVGKPGKRPHSLVAYGDLRVRVPHVR